MPADALVKGPLGSVAERLRGAGVQEPRQEAAALVAAAIHGSAREPAGLTEQQADRLERLVVRRIAHEPLAYILGEAAFRDNCFAVSPDVLAPQRRTRATVEACLSLIPASSDVAILDLGVGAGTILLSILAERPNATGVGADISEQALAIATRNASVMGLSARTQFVCSDWGRDIDGRFGLIVSNPPYVPRAAIHQLKPEYWRYSPALAIDGGDDGLQCYRAVFPAIARLLRPGGHFVVEIGDDLTDAVWVSAVVAGLRPVAARAGVSGARPRVLIGRSADRSPSRRAKALPREDERRR